MASKFIPAESYDPQKNVTYISQIQTVGFNDIYEYNEILLDSDERDNGTMNHPMWALQTPLANVIGVKVISVTVPFSWYSINSTNNTFIAMTRSSGGGNPTAYTITLTPGNYTASELATLMQTALRTALSDSTITVTFSITTNKFTITQAAAAPATYLYGLWFSRYISSVSGHFGMLDSGITDDNFYGVANYSVPANIAKTNIATLNAVTGYREIISPYVAQVWGYSYVLLCGQSAGRLSRYVNINGLNTPEPPVMAKIPIAANRFEVFNYTDDSPQYFFEYGNKGFQRLEFWFTLGDGLKEIDFNGVSFQIKLGVLTEKTLRTLESSENRSSTFMQSKRSRMN
jgi:hypothetical protein